MSTVIEKRSPSGVASRPAPRITGEADSGPMIHRVITDDMVCVLTFDRPNSAANVFDRRTLEELGDHLGFIETHSDLRGVVIRSAKDKIFVAGADLNSLANAKEPVELRVLIALGQDTFNRLAELKIPTVAAIHGACVGGGYEVCLACDLRVATDDKATKIGLPETQLGIIPAWGGSTRLPRLIGLPAALDIILAGKTVSARKAHKLGMIDAIAPSEKLRDIAEQLVVRSGCKPRGHQRPSVKKLFALNNRLVSSVIEKRIRPDLLKRTRGHYPGITKALEVMINGLKAGVKGSLKMEADAIVELANTDAAANLIQIFFMQERARKLNVLSNRNDSPMKRGAVIGAGVMGSGIAQWLSSRGMEVTLRDINAAAVARGMENAKKICDQGVRRRKFTATEARQGLDRISPVYEPVPMKRAEIVIEAAVERMDLKEDLFHQLEDLTSKDTILATNTSALSITHIARNMLVPERVVGIHFFNPVHRMQLVEVIRGEKTDPEILHRAVKFVRQLGKLPVVEAALLFEQGADIHDIDESMLDFGMPMGPLRLIDEVGVDVARHVCDTLAGPCNLAVPPVLTKMLEKKWLGCKTGKGFYLHQGKRAEPNADEIKLMRDDKSANRPLGQLQSRMVLLMINEAARCLEEEIVEQPSDIDFAMIMGTGFAPFRGGPLHFADTFGLRRVVREMNILVESGERQFHPCDLLTDMARADRKFYPTK
jgi:3-hydroxyacyl-CoA dehydrogenase/enoyl-CoA hydratase/3-hydroxybutyryl-CoA epimerase